MNAKEIINNSKDEFLNVLSRKYNDDAVYTSEDCSPADAYLYETGNLGIDAIIEWATDWLDMTEEERIEDAKKYLDAVEWDKNRLYRLYEKYDDDQDHDDEYEPASAQEMAIEITRAIENVVDDISSPF